VAQESQKKGREAVPSVRAIPADHEAERAVLGAILLDHDALYQVLDRLKAHHFDHPRHRILYEACSGLAQKNQPPTLITLRNYLEENGLLEAAGGTAFVAQVADSVPTAAHIGHHARVVNEKALARDLIRTCERVAVRGYEGGVPVQVGHAEIGFTGIHDELGSTFEYIQKLQEGEIVGVQTGFKDFDKMTGGLSGGDLVVLAARPSVGKTALALNIARNCAVDHKGCVALFSLEMTKRQLTLRLLMAEAEIDYSRFRNGYLGEGDFRRLTQAADTLQDARIFIDDSGAISVSDMGARARRLHREHHVTLIVVDYIQLIQNRVGSERREQEVAETTRALKLLAKDLDVPILALSQLNRGPEGRPNPHKRPVLADLRESGAIEQDADMVVFIYRDELYNEDTPDRGIAELNFAKQRNGPTGKIFLQFETTYARFHNHSGRDAPPPELGFDPSPSFEGGGESEPPF
jgi:replicative DNA helicase